MVTASIHNSIGESDFQVDIAHLRKKLRKDGFDEVLLIVDRLQENRDLARNITQACKIKLPQELKVVLDFAGIKSPELKITPTDPLLKMFTCAH